MVSIVKGLHIAGKETGTESIKRFRHYRHVVDKSALLFDTIPWEIRDMLHCIIQWKETISPSHYGELYSNLQHLSRGDEHNTYCGMLCDRSKFALVQCKNLTFWDVTEGKWTDPGTIECIREFSNRKNDWLVLLDDICGQLNVELHVNSKLKTAFLGAGAMGRVFEVKHKDTDQVFALKLVLGWNNHGSIDQILTLAREEFDAMCDMADCDSVMNVVENSFTTCTEIGEGVGYLMTTIGDKVDSSINKKTRREIFMSLLKLHRFGRTHGDARLAHPRWTGVQIRVDRLDAEACG
jgi:hypothetical protein